MNAKSILAALLVAMVVASGTATAAGIALDPTTEQYPETYYQEDTLTVTSHDMEEIEFLEWVTEMPLA